MHILPCLESIPTEKGGGGEEGKEGGRRGERKVKQGRMEGEERRVEEEERREETDTYVKVIPNLLSLYQ